MARGIPHEVVRHFQQIPLFASVSKKGIRAIAHASTEIDIPAGSVLVREGESGRHLYVITRGVAVVTKKGRKVRELVPGDFFGEMAFLNPEPRTATVTAHTDMRVMVLGPQEMDVIVGQQPVVAKRLLEVMAKRVQSNERTPPPV